MVEPSASPGLRRADRPRRRPTGAAAGAALFAVPPEPGHVIVAETPSAYRFVTQPEHARLAGRFAERWGDGPFDRPAPYPAAVAAAHTHDDGWWPYDRRPHLDADGAPVTFTSLPAPAWTELYDRGVEAVVELDRYAGLLVSMHGAGLRRRRYGLSPSWPDTPPAFAEFVDRQEARQRELLAALADRDDAPVSPDDEALLASLHETGEPPDGTASRLWTNYALLQAWDALSLSFCTSVSPTDDEIAAVPRRPGGPDATLSLEPGADGGVTVEPYPFDADPLVARVAARTVEKAAFDDEDELVGAYYAAGLEPFAVELRSPG